MITQAYFSFISGFKSLISSVTQFFFISTFFKYLILTSAYSVCFSKFTLFVNTSQFTLGKLCIFTRVVYACEIETPSVRDTFAQNIYGLGYIL